MSEYLTSVSLIDQLVEKMLFNQSVQRVREYKEHMDPRQFRGFFQTIRLELPRTSGHTTAAENLWFRYRTVTVVPQEESRRRFLHNHILPRTQSPMNIAEFPSHRIFVPREDFGKGFSKALEKFRGYEEHELPELLVFDEAHRMRITNVHMEDVVEVLSSMIFERFPDTMKGVIVLQ